MQASTHVLVPLKRLGDAKSRLAGLLSPSERAELMRAMLADVLDAVAGARTVAAVTLVSSEPAAAELAREHGVGWWDDRGLAWNDALAAAMREVVSAPCAAVVSADIPLVTAVDVDELVIVTPKRGLAVARATDAGTNAVSMRPAGVLETCFGSPGSAALHLELARAARLEGVLVDRPGLALDLDTPEDVERLFAVARPTRTASLLSLALTREVSA